MLFITKILLIIWGVLGFTEYFFPAANFGLQDSNFPKGTQFLHWLLIVLTGSIFAIGFLYRLRFTVFATITMYATLATLCFIETVDFNPFGGGTRRYFIMSAEFILYIILSVFLLKSNEVKKHFRYSEVS